MNRRLLLLLTLALAWLALRRHAARLAASA